MATSAFFVTGAVILIFDMRGRRLDFRNASNYLVDGHEPLHVAKTYQYSWCSRAACRAAAAGIGEREERAIIAYYRDNGYRWFHIFPDNTFSLNSPFLKLRFWKITLFGNKGAAEVLEKKKQSQPSSHMRDRKRREAA